MIKFKQTKLHVILFIVSVLFLIVTCSQNTSNKSRQFEKNINIEVLTKNRENVNLNLRCWYEFISNSNKTFDEKGMFIEENENSHGILEAHVRSAVRTVIKKYTSEELYLAEKGNVKNEIYDEVKKFGKDSVRGLKIQYNEFLIGEIEFPEYTIKAKNSNLLSAQALLRSEKPEERLKAVKNLLMDGSKASYSLILDHWAIEKNDKIKSFILKELSDN